MDFQTEQPLPPNNFSSRRIFFFAAAGTVLILAAFLVFANFKIYSARSADNTNQIFVVAPGQRAKTVAENLYGQGLIGSPWAFNFYLWFTGGAGKIQAGSYSFSGAMNIRQIADQLVSGNVQFSGSILQFKEGWSIDDISAYLQRDNIISKAQFDRAQAEFAAKGMFGEKLPDNSLEGYIFPDTYFVGKNADAAEIINKALNNLDAKLTAPLRAEIAAQHKTIYQILIMASIVEKEVGRHTTRLTDSDPAELQTERKIVAGIFYKRLQLGIALQSDATVDYGTRKKNPSASYLDFKIDSPYNTYKYPGLPLGPISNPSLSSILAAIYPQSSDYLYFLTKPDGTAVFAKTLQEQNKNKNLYMK